MMKPHLKLIEYSNIHLEHVVNLLLLFYNNYHERSKGNGLG